MVGTVATVVTAATVTISAGVEIVAGAVVECVVPAGVEVTIVMSPEFGSEHPAAKRPPTSTATRASSRAVFAIN